ncbi:site-specific DNA-methyltransferase [Sporosarcina sp. FSL W8-0480]|uniref:DNA-methyltransferase n=1 Tax=Sporosarcina sp. FSL W8-0480 TaxID=2954701 RepID=UPI0030D71FC2
MNMTKHSILNKDAANLQEIPDGSVSLVITSPPYPMIEMWDEIFMKQKPEIEEHLMTEPYKAFNLMHDVLNDIWEEVDKKVANHGFVCINIGDATRTIDGHFQMYSNHSKIIEKFVSMGYSVLPDIIWRKTTNAPNKFMGSGMLPSGAYVTYEHEYILIFRKGGKRVFKNNEKAIRQESAFFWEERNQWFSDLWEFQGKSQKFKNISSGRERSAAYPFELAYRLINMYSMKGDTILDPFVGTGTSMFAAMCAERNSYGVEIDPLLAETVTSNALLLKKELNDIVVKRFQRHTEFIEQQLLLGKDKWYENDHLDTKVKTRQEVNIKLSLIDEITREDDFVTVSYEDLNPKG